MDFLSGLFDALANSSTYVNAALFAGLLIFAASGEWIAERSGTINISVEGMLLAGAFTSAAGYTATDSFLVGIVCGILGGIAVASVQAEMSHRLTADQFVVGLTLNILILGLAGFLAREIDLVTTTATKLKLPGLHRIPLFGDALFFQPWPFFVLYLIVPLSWWLMFRTRWGLEVRASGEDPQAADVSGIDVNKRRRQAIYYAGFTAGLGGAYLLFVQVGRFDEGSVSGRGFIAIAAVIFGGWTLRGTIAGCLVFALALALRLQLPNYYEGVPTELLQAFPFLVTILGMAIFAKRVRPPAALARPFIRGLK
ncbi:MAG: ABC transporter permease [Acidimicrobiia bacterium]|nr:ABC transporter permease [Acidimicrobiia bacterium]